MESMVDRCTHFCPLHSIPILMGSTTFGVNFDYSAQIISALMGTDLKYFSKAELDTCVTQRDAFSRIQESFSDVLTQFIKFNSAVLRYRSHIMVAVTNSTTQLDSSKTGDDIQHATGSREKINVITELYSRIIKSEVMVRERTILSTMLTETEQAIVSFDSEFDSQMKLVTSFVTNCSDKRFPPINEKVMLDMCTISGTYCIDKPTDGVEHVTCGCLVNLAVNLGGGGGGAGVMRPLATLRPLVCSRSSWPK